MARNRGFALVGAIALLTATAVACSGAGGSGAAGTDSPAIARELADAVLAPDSARLPILFVHGELGSGSQFETEAQRFTSNGYPINHIDAFDYDASSYDMPEDKLFPALDAKIASLLKQTGAKQLDLVAHASGAVLSQDYLASSAQRAGQVAHYVSIEGRAAPAPPAGIPTLAIWGGGDPTRRILGATNTRFVELGRVEATTSAKSFKEMYTFLTGSEPRTTDVVPRKGEVEISGRAVLYPANVGVSDARLEIHLLDPKTGLRQDNSLKGFFKLSGDGSWGPFQADPAASYEFVIVRAGQPDHHFYYQPFRRDDHLVRLQTSDPGHELGGGMEVDSRHTNLTVLRTREWWGDQSSGSDALTVDGTDILNAANTPRSKQATDLYLFDRNSDESNDLAAPINTYFVVWFITGIDIYIPSGQRSVEVTMTPRGRVEHRAVLHVPAWPSDSHRITLHFNDDG